MRNVLPTNHFLSERRFFNRRGFIIMVTAMSILGSTIAVALSPPAMASSTAPYELFCRMPIGHLVMNGTVTTGLSPTTVQVGQSFNLDGYQTTLIVPSAIVEAYSALGYSDVTGSLSPRVDAKGATPGSFAPGPQSFSTPIPAHVPAAGLTVKVPGTAMEVGPFKVTSRTAVGLSEYKKTVLTLTMASSPTEGTCTSYANNALPSGITASSPSGSPINPLITSVTVTSGRRLQSPPPRRTPHHEATR